MDGFVELREKTRDLRKGLLATTVLVDASVATCNEWLTVVTDYVGPHLNYISGKFLDHQVRNSKSSSTRRLQTDFLASNRFRHLRVIIDTPESHSLQAIL